MATTAPVQKRRDSKQDELDRLAKDFFELTESRLAKMGSEERERVIVSIHATAETLGGSVNARGHPLALIRLHLRKLTLRQLEEILLKIS